MQLITERGAAATAPRNHNTIPLSSNAEKRRAVRKLLQNPKWAALSDSLIAERLGVSQPFVSARRRELHSKTVLSNETGAAAQPSRRRGRDGVLRETTRIGRREQPDTLKPTTEIHQRRRTRALALVGQLTRLAPRYPEFRATLAKANQELREQANRTPENDRQMVLAAIHTGAWTVDELLEDTRLTRPELDKILKGLIAAKIIFVKTSKEKSRLGGRPKLLYLPHPNHQPQK